MNQDIRFCTTSDGVRIAYAVSGQGSPIVRGLGWFTHLEREEETSWWSNMNRMLSERHTLIRYDGRGMGLSDPDVDDFSLDAKVRDMEAVMEATGVDSASVFGVSEGGTTAVAYTAKHPDKVRKLIIYGSTPWYGRLLSTSEGRDAARLMLDLVRKGWGSDAPMYRQFFTGMFMPDATGEAVRQFTEFQKHTASAENVVAMMTALAQFDVREICSRITVPTLVIHRRGDTTLPFAEGREFAALIPGARFMPQEGRNHVPFPEEPQTAEMFDAILEFTEEGEEAAKSAPAGEGGLVTVLFTDLVGHTEMMARLGDARGREVLREHETITRRVLGEHAGVEIKTMGDGFMASFKSVAKAVACAIALQRAFAEREGEPLAVRVGLNAGEPIEDDGDLFGATVILASRIAARAEAEEILVSNTIRELCSGKGFLFADRGDFVAKGFEDTVRLYEVSWRE